jgi:hypothetical protein
MNRDEVVWRAPAPLWPRVRTNANAFEVPVLLRFAGDDFMEQFGTALALEDGFAPLVAATETWQDPGAGLDRAASDSDGQPITLFQPTHGRFYLVTASLVCRRYGHPDRRVAVGADERASFLLRRLAPSSGGEIDPDRPETYREHGWVAGRWRPASAISATDDEERLPLFTTTATIDGRPRRVLAGLVPASGREAREHAPPVDPEDLDGSTDPLAPLADPRLAELEPAVVGLQQVLRHGALAELALVRESLFFTFVDLAEWLDGEHGHLPGSLRAGREVLDALEVDFLPADGGDALSWREALVAAREAWPEAVFEVDEDEPEPVAGLTLADLVDAIDRLGVAIVEPPADEPVPPTATEFFRAVVTALAEADDERGQVGSASSGTSGTTATEAAMAGAAADPASVYVVRCLYERPHCRPPDRQRLSRSSRPFRLAGFHEPDAPARPVRIALPVDTSPAGLRRFPKNVSVVLSNELRRQMDRVGTDTLRDDTLGPPRALDFGMICSLSIPIITICALLLLMIIVQVLNIVFFWVPLFKICLPIPRSRGS